MTLAPGQKLGPYEILAPLGAGGMGEVYRGRDARLDRVVAIKVLPEDLFEDKDRRRRFEQEAKLLAALNHANIAAIYSFEEIPGSPVSPARHVLVMELIEGKSLRETLAAGALSSKKLLDLSGQIAEGLSKAHAAGIVHRDLKPENVMVSKDGVVKILDFGLAKILKDQPERGTDVPTATRAGTVMGTVGYMSPEQASGKPADYRSDQFSLGSILYEMASGRRAFERSTGAETLTAIIREEPEPLGRLSASVPGPFRWLVERCLQKDPEERYASTRDLARDLKSIREHLSDSSVSAPDVSGRTPVPAGALRRRGSRAALAVVALLLGLAAGALLEKRLSRTAPPSYQQITFGSGTIRSARFAPDGQTIVFSAAWDGAPLKLFLKHPSSPDSLPLALPSANLLGISPSGEMAIAVDCRSNHPGLCAGTLARAALTGGSPRDVAEGIQEVDWASDGASMVVVRDVGGKSRIEFPMGKVLYETAGHVSYARLSPKGDRIAFLDHGFPLDDAGTVAVIDLAGKKTKLTGQWASEHGLAWAPSGNEVWFTATEAGANRSLYAVDLSGQLRVVTRVPGGLKLHDIAKSGKVLLTRESPRVGILGMLQGDIRERDMSFLDYSFAADLSAEGKLLLFDEEGEAGGANYTVYLRKSDHSPVVRLGEGNALALAPDGKWAVSILPLPNSPIRLLPTGTGEPRELALPGLSAEQAAAFVDSKRILFAASEPGHGVRLYMQEIEGGKPRPVTPEGISTALPGFAVSSDGKAIAAIGPEQKGAIFPVDGGAPRPIPGLLPGEFPLRFAADGRSIFVWKRGDLPARITRVDLESGKRDVFKDLLPADPAGVERISNVLVTPDGKGYAYCYARLLSDLFVVEGLK